MNVNYEDGYRRGERFPEETDAFSGRLSSTRAAVGPGVLLVLILAISYAVAHHEGASQRIERSWNSLSPAGLAGKAKPSPGIPWGPKQRVAPPVAVAPAPEPAPLLADSVANNVVAAAPEAAPSAIPAKVLKPRETEGAFAAKHRKSFGRGCDGRLSLTARGLDFQCDSGSEPDLHIASEDIKGASGNGVELKSGEKFHFDLQRSRSEEQEIFRDWASTHLESTR